MKNMVLTQNAFFKRRWKVVGTFTMLMLKIMVVNHGFNLTSRDKSKILSESASDAETPMF